MSGVPVLASRTWRDYAACRDVDPDLFFPPSTEGPATEAQIAAAKKVCAACPVKAPCLGWAHRYRQEAGVWGGMSEEERAAERLSLTRGTA